MCLQDIFTSNACEAVLPVVQQDNFAGYLFADEEVRAIAVDGANRKWVGTRNGVWLISADGQKVISRFTETNSPLLSNVINNIVIHPQTGEVFISTFNGICSYRGSATEGTENIAMCWFSLILFRRVMAVLLPFVAWHPMHWLKSRKRMAGWFFKQELWVDRLSGTVKIIMEKR